MPLLIGGAPVGVSSRTGRYELTPAVWRYSPRSFAPIRLTTEKLLRVGFPRTQLLRKANPTPPKFVLIAAAIRGIALPPKVVTGYCHSPASLILIKLMFGQERLLNANGPGQGQVCHPPRHRNRPTSHDWPLAVWLSDCGAQFALWLGRTGTAAK